MSTNLLDIGKDVPRNNIAVILNLCMLSIEKEHLFQYVCNIIISLIRQACVDYHVVSTYQPIWYVHMKLLL